MPLPWSSALLACTLLGQSPDDLAHSAQRLLAERCLKCHGGVRERSRLNLHSPERAARPAASGKPAIVPHDPDGSELLIRLASSDPDERMPPEGEPLTGAERSLLRAWIEAGAPEAKHWSFVAPVEPARPLSAANAWCRQPLDGFVLDALLRDGLSPSPEADRATLLRRASLDLIGLPPTEAELAHYLEDKSAGAYERAVDRLLASPAYGERWAARWLDLARYADTLGYEKDGARTIWAWRDWVISALNTNMPFDEFTRLQLAGDLVSAANDMTRTATAFHRNTLNNAEGGTDDEEFRTSAVMDRVATTWHTWMGLSMQCVQCHAHPYDDLEHTDYYRFMDFLNQQADADTDDDAPTLALNTAHGATTVPVLQELSFERRRVTHRFERGAFASPADVVTAGTPASLHPFDPAWPTDRRGLVEWLLSTQNPLTPRVIANRIWESIFGVGIVATSEDFGVLGDPPSHPALLDHLAIALRDGGWNTKAFLRSIVLSATYRQDNAYREDAALVDPDTRLMWRSPRPRLDAEMVRDSALLVSGLLNRTIGGPSVMPPQPDGIWNIVYNGAQWTTSEGDARHRRALYTYWRRSAPYPSMMMFDAVDRTTCTVRRVRTNTPLAALVMMNDPAFVECAVALARPVASMPTDEAIATIVHRALLRPPRPAEVGALRQLAHDEIERYATNPADATALVGGDEHAIQWAAYASVASAILNTDEFLCRP